MPILTVDSEIAHGVSVEVSSGIGQTVQFGYGVFEDSTIQFSRVGTTR